YLLTRFAISPLLFSHAPTTPEIYSLSLHDALPILSGSVEQLALNWHWLARGRWREQLIPCARLNRPEFPQHLIGKRVSLDLIISDRKSTRLNSSHVANSYAVFCLKKKNDALTVAPQ